MTVALVNVPTLVKLDPVTVDFIVVPVNVPASAVTVMSPLPSKSTLFIFLAVVNFVAVVDGVVHVKVPLPVEVKTCPLVPAAVNPVPPFSTATAVPLHTPLVMVPTVAKLDKEVNVVLISSEVYKSCNKQ